MGDVLEYLRFRGQFVLLLIFFVFVQTVVFYLYHIAMEPFFYSLGLCFFIGIIFMVWDYRRFYLRHKVLAGVKAAAPDDIGGLPPAENRIEEDYRDLVETLYRRGEEIREEQERRYDDFVSYFTVWAHQVKTPIAGLDLMFQSGGNGEAREELRRIRRYVDMALCYLRLDSDSTDYVFRKYDIDNVARKAVRSFAGQFIRKKIRLEYTPVDFAAITDEKWLGFVVEQILANALKYTPGGGVVTVAKDGNNRLQIRDSGIGIAAEDLPRIFDWGYTGANGRRGEHSSGLGLYLCGRILKNLGHPITVRSEAGKGTVVTIDFSGQT